jgi:hypothetical protein
MYPGSHKIPTHDYKLYTDDRFIVQRVEKYQPLNPSIICGQMRSAPNMMPVDLSPQIEVLGIIEKKGPLRWIEGREYITVYPNERTAKKTDFGIRRLDNMEDERRTVDDIIQKMFDSKEEYWIVDSVIQMREMGPLDKFKLPLRKK